jgi:hypothetical protein
MCHRQCIGTSTLINLYHGNGDVYLHEMYHLIIIVYYHTVRHSSMWKRMTHSHRYIFCKIHKLNSCPIIIFFALHLQTIINEINFTDDVEIVFSLSQEK